MAAQASMLPPVRRSHERLEWLKAEGRKESFNMAVDTTASLSRRKFLGVGLMGAAVAVAPCLLSFFMPKSPLPTPPR